MMVTTMRFANDTRYLRARSFSLLAVPRIKIGGILESSSSRMFLF